MTTERILFVTGRFAEQSLREVVSELATKVGFVPHVAATKISVAALLHVDWLAGQLAIDEPVDRVILPGWCQGDLSRLVSQFKVPFELGPKDLFDLPEHFGSKQKKPVDLSQYTIEILAEINHAPRMTDQEIVALADHYHRTGADFIDLGCIPGESWGRVADVTKLLVDRGLRVSIDSFDRKEVEAAVRAGAELVLSCNQSNIDWASQLDAELVAIPEAPFSLDSLEQTVQQLTDCGAGFRVDPILEPIGFGFAASLGRYFEARKQWPDLDIMMGIGNLTELTEVDSAGMNFLLAGICEELQIRSVLTTEVINWARSSVQEFDLARRLTRHSVQNRALPKHVDSQLVTLRDPKLREQGEAALATLAGQITDPNYRIFAERGEIHIMNRDGYWRGSDPFELFRRVRENAEKPLSEGHSFYLGYEVCKAATALRLGKQYVQDEELSWGFLSSDDSSNASGRHQTAY
ncbi:MAG: dihydropteroate synthase [Planctomycetaceae bacterium]|nr:dihydropteroate synthase [Planctomycetaceae bacterium]